jgi:hypothetical protein
MRIRSIRPEFWTSEDIAKFDWHTRLIFIGLWSYVDDNGVGRDVEPLITAALFPLDDSFSESSLRVHGALMQLEKGGQISRYSVGGKPYFHVSAFDTHQKINRPSPGRYPLPTSADAVLSEPLSESSVSPHADAPLGEGEKGRRGEEFLSDESDDLDLFDEFWKLYPRKEAKQAARKAWASVTKKVEPQDVIDGLVAYAFNPDPKFRPLPASWLNGQRWEDEATVHQLHAADPHAGKKRMVWIESAQRWREIHPEEFVMGQKVEWR